MIDYYKNNIIVGSIALVRINYSIYEGIVTKINPRSVAVTLIDYTGKLIFHRLITNTHHKLILAEGNQIYRALRYPLLKELYDKIHN